MDLAASPSPPLPRPCPSKDNTAIVVRLVVLAVIAMFLLHILGSLRRLSSNSLLHAVVVGVYTLSYPLVGYTIGRMDSSGWAYYDFAVWAVFLLLLLGSTDSLTACRLSDIESWKSIYVKHLYKGFLLVSIVLKFSGGAPYLLPLSAILLVVVLKWYVMIASMRVVSKEYLCKNVKVVADYMRHKDNLLVPFDPVTMEGYRYMVAGEKYCIGKRRPAGCSSTKDDDLTKVTTVEQVWRSTGSLLVHERGKLLKDVCLSMALSKMLNRRFAGFEISEAGLDKTHDFVFKGLLAGDDKPYQRAFRVVEEELVFVHDIYYTRYSYLYQKGPYLALCLPVTMFALWSWLICRVVKHRSHGDRSLSDATIFIAGVLAFLEAYQLYLYIASGWFKVALIRSYVVTTFWHTRSGCFLEMIIGLLLRLKGFRPWKDKLGQYCVLQALGHRNRVRNCLHYATLHLVDKAKNKKGCKNSVRLSENVKKAIVDCLLGSNGHLTNGVASLRNNGVHGQLSSWACDTTATDGMVTRNILVWHVATTLCEHQLDAAGRNQDTVRTASILSGYCMHLLAFEPNLLPDHCSISESILDKSIEEADKLLKGAKTMKIRCDKLMKIGTHDGDSDEAPLVEQGALLARHLIEHIPEPTLRWKVLADFWAEMMLYVSPSDDARAHLEALARGGEFITHLWALLTHAGVLKRGPTGPKDVV
ncbi:unnamed protein product [Miscanthus lutarioriparius]|uniref:DUF4220 domain-containing protein n=1 Tax=Miscanthus lutarioriparius TaxID=422564 RepID=A0A811QAR9_9POAL|nr:unnamed protein product [Miscanthus lutarioriparius]